MCTFLLLNFIIIGLCNSSANSLLEIILFLIADLFASIVDSPEKILSKKKTIEKKSPLWYPSYFGFLTILNALSHNAFYIFIYHVIL